MRRRGWLGRIALCQGNRADARKLGLEVHVIESLTEPVSEELGIAARQQMLSAGVILD